MKEITFKDGSQFSIDVLPDECPRCHRLIMPIRRESFEPFRDGLQIVFQCPGCRELFITFYDGRSGYLRFETSEPKRHKEQSFGSIDGISPLFPVIFNQAAEAEAAGLDQIAGLGYRKSLEFLIKDFCIVKNPEFEEAIKAEPLGVVIKNRLDDRKIKLAAEKVAWLGNDEAHYVRKWEDHDIEHLKKLLSIAVNGIKEDLELTELLASFTPPTSP
jgi:hypothetical protein